MAILLVQSAVSTGGVDPWAGATTNTPFDLPAPATAGNLIIVGHRIGDGAGSGTVSTIAEAGTTAYARARNQQNATLGVYLELWWGIAAGASAGQDIVSTITANGSSTDNYIFALEFSGNTALQSGIQVNGANISNLMSHDSGSVTPATAANVIVGMSTGGSAEWINDADFTTVLDNSRSIVGYRIQAAATAQPWTITSDINRFSALAIAAFDGTAGGAAALNRMALLGVG